MTLVQLNRTHANLKNLSLDGAQVVTASTWHTDRVRVSLTAPWGGATCAARVVWVVRDASRAYDTPHFRVGLQLLNANPTIIKRVLEAIGDTVPQEL